MSMKKTLETARALGITLKNLKTFPGHDAGVGFDADICVDGKKVLHVYDSAHGGCFEYTPCDSDYKKAREVEANLEEKLKAFPEHEVEMGGGRTYMSRDTLDCVIGALVSDHEWAKEIKKSEKKGIVVETKFGLEVIKFKAGTLTALLKKYEQKAVSMMIQGHVKKLIKDGEVILNQKYLESIGVKF